MIPVDAGFPTGTHGFPLDERRRRRHKLRNTIQSMALIGGLGVLAAAIGGLIAGPLGILWMMGVVGAMLAFGPALSPAILLRLYGARRFGHRERPEIQEAVALLAWRARLSGVPALYRLETPVPSAFTVGPTGNGAIVLTDGLLRTMSLRELEGILAHEISHIRNHDLGTMALAELIGRVAQAMATTGLILLIVNLPLTLRDGGSGSWPLIALLLTTPTLNTLLQRRLARTREYDADLDAAALTGDPAGLVAALVKLDADEERFRDRRLGPGRRPVRLSLLRTHPQTAARVERLMSLQRASQGRRPAR
ncbi:heat shock protein HtpX [Azospirillum agricola]|uniref:zinc metalloprotease HtpX n=1 Tax=Azospirillum agricola TaxID=1720247 RepID=UPI001AE7EED2|nr:zinc metalloprotease HtpX [Azospirillum agricola]MBP2233250.1 heat shock protein HtpX [Azospirillum agricola]